MARALVDAGYAVVGDDHRGHGETGLKAGGLGDLGPRGMAGVLDAVHSVTGWIADEYPGVPIFLLGHSWGSFLAQRYIRQWGGELAGVLLTGTTMRAAGQQRERRRVPDVPAGTYDWLTRDASEVQRYVDDPLCGFERMGSRPADSRTTSSGTEAGWDEPRGRPPATLPILIFNGADDRIGGEDGGRALAAHYASLGISDVTVLSYAGARHELFNELNRDEVTRDVLAWLAART